MLPDKRETCARDLISLAGPAGKLKILVQVVLVTARLTALNTRFEILPTISCKSFVKSVFA